MVEAEKKFRLLFEDNPSQLVFTIQPPEDFWKSTARLPRNTATRASDFSILPSLTFVPTFRLNDSLRPSTGLKFVERSGGSAAATAAFSK